MSELTPVRINALVGVVILGLVAMTYQKLDEVLDRATDIEERVRDIEEDARQAQMAETEGRLDTLEFHTRNALYAAVPCDRDGGLCPVESDLDRRAAMTRQLLGLGSQDLRGVNLQGVNLSGMDLTGVDLTGAQLDFADLSGAVLDTSDLRNASLHGANLTGASLQGALLVSADLSDAGLENADLRGAQLQAATLEGAHACGADFAEAQLGSASLEGAALYGADFSQTDLHGHFRGAEAGPDTKWAGQMPAGLDIKDTPHKRALAINPAYGPDAAPFLGGDSEGSTCPNFHAVATL